MAHILYIEDDSDSITLARKVLNSRGYKVMRAQSGLNEMRDPRTCSRTLCLTRRLL